MAGTAGGPSMQAAGAQAGAAGSPARLWAAIVGSRPIDWPPSAVCAVGPPAAQGGMRHLARRGRSYAEHAAPTTRPRAPSRAPVAG